MLDFWVKKVAKQPLKQFQYFEDDFSNIRQFFCQYGTKSYSLSIHEL